MFAACAITENEDSSVVMPTTHIQLHFYLILVVEMTLGLWGAQADVLPLLLNKQSILQSNYSTT